MNSVLAVVLPFFLFHISESNAMQDRKTCPVGLYTQMNTDNNVTFFTDNTYNYSQIWLRPTSSRLGVFVKACKDAHFKLQTSNASIAYEIVLGANANFRTDIRDRSKKILNDSITPGLLRCYEYVPFVIAWNESRIVVKRGTTNLETIIEWAIPSRNMDVMLITLTGYPFPHQVEDRHFEEYQFKESEVSSFGVNTPARSAYKIFRRTLYGKDGVTFKLKTSGEAKLAFLASDNSNFSQPTHTLRIGAEDNAQTIFYLNTHLLLSNHTPGLLSSEELREFWVAWKDGRFGFGLGSEFYKNCKLVSSDLLAVDRIHSMAVDSTSLAQWEFASSAEQGYSCVSTCQVGWYPDEKSGNCQQCSMRLSNCSACTKSQSPEYPVCTACVKGTVLLGERGECLADCPPRLGYSPDYDRRECICAYGPCCGPVSFRLCFVALPCLLGLILVAVLLVAIRKVRRLRLINLDNIDFDQLLMIIKLIPPQAMENFYAVSMMDQPLLPLSHDIGGVPMATSMTSATGETSFNRGGRSNAGNTNDPSYIDMFQQRGNQPQHRGKLPPIPPNSSCL